MTLNPLAKQYCKSEKEYEILKNWVDTHNRLDEKDEMNIQFSGKEFENELKKVKDKIDKSIAKIFT